MKPFYYYADGKKFVCGSEIHQLFHCDVPCEPNEEVVGEYLACRTYSAEPTLYRGILQLLPAHLLIVSRDRLVTRRYYDLDPAREIRHRNDDEYADHFLSIFKEALKCRLRAVGPVAADLSGGIDSSIGGLSSSRLRCRTSNCGAADSSVTSFAMRGSGFCRKWSARESPRAPLIFQCWNPSSMTQR
jgi:asparagine synthase (glutamine-hydrolysing)